MDEKHSLNIAARIIAAGGGSGEDERPLVAHFANRVGTGKILYVPAALKGLRPFDECLEWVQRALGQCGVTDIDMWTDLSAENHGALDGYAGIYIGGGNTYSLLAQVRESGFDIALRGYLDRGGAVYGGSAGAILLGRDILTCSHLDHNDIGLTDTRGLDELGGCCVWCHYQPADDPLIEAFLAQYGWPVLAISERAGVSYEDGVITAMGYDPTQVFTTGGRQAAAPGERITIPSE